MDKNVVAKMIEDIATYVSEQRKFEFYCETNIMKLNHIFVSANCYKAAMILIRKR